MNTPHVDTSGVRHFAPLIHSQPTVPPPKTPSVYSYVVASGSRPVDLGDQRSPILTEFRSLFT